MHRWSFQRFVRWLIPALVFLVSLCALVMEQKASKAGLAFAEDGAYVNLGVARTLAGQGLYALDPQQKMPATRDVLWRLLLAVAGGVTGNYVTASYLLAAAFSLVTLLICLRLLRLLFPFPPFMLFSAVLLIVTPRLLTDALDGTSAALATTLVTAAVLLHVEGLAERRAPLPGTAAFFVALLTWLRVEFALVWLVLCVHAGLLTLLSRRRDDSFMLVVTRGLTGFLTIALMLIPLLAWNLQVVRVPWPQSVGAPLALDASLSPQEALRAYGGIVRGVIGASYARLHAIPFLSGRLAQVFTWFGVLFIAGLGLWRREERPYTVILFLLLLLPPAFALLYPVVGWASADVLFGALNPLCVVAASFGMFRIPFLLEQLYRKWKEGIPQAPGFGAWWIAAGSLLLIVSLVRTGSFLKARVGDIMRAEEGRRQVSELLQGGAPEAVLVATDAPGWMAWELRKGVVDLTGEATPEVLACLDPEGRLDPEELGPALADRKPGALVLWDSRNEFVASLVPGQPLGGKSGSVEGWPRVYALNWSGVF